MRFLPAVVLTFMMLFRGAPLAAAELTDLYQAEVDANQSQQAWQQAAFAAVLLKLTGNDAIMANAQVQAELKQAGNYIKQYQMVQREGRHLFVVSLDQQKITSLLAQQQVPVWGSRRPDVLLWLSEKTLSEPKFVLEHQHPLRTALAEQEKKYGLSFIYPFYDVDDLALVNESSVWAGDWTSLGSASLRYNAERVQNLLIEQLQDASGQLQYRLTRQQQQNGEMVLQEFTAATMPELMAQFAKTLAGELSAQYAINLHQTSSAGGEAGLQLTISGVQSLTDLVQLQKIFSSMLTVRQHQLVSFSQQQAVIALQLTATVDDFYRALALEKQLQPEQPADLSATSTAPAATDIAATTPSVAEVTATESSDNADSAISAAELAMEQALQQDGAAAELPTDTTLALQNNSGTTLAPKSSHYRYIKP
ncbi:DUF2066 domain-containing protein [Rheinheimera sp. 4Y26]|uniref:DUF2066 domain-containing protein n=1 Tax=Rheinheimera sp. 4Y26 TaxID=2977811 RepID=UPI0021B0A0A6|nr:DUF2066 domain-containing protein [Rheinheimera sp. 4Y26]MCT6699612.1 DUF2066 domain-containing protein [Rheinheimera sp. 4Y26]